MRLVMVMKTSVIDAPTLAEGEALASQGHEVIVLAAREKGQPRFEQLGSVKIERYDSHAPGQPPRRFYQSMWLYLTLAVGRLGLRIARRIARSLGLLVAHCATRVSRAVIGILRGHRELSSWEQEIAWRIEFYQPDVVQVRDRRLLRASERGMRSDGQLPAVENACNSPAAWVVRSEPS